MKRETYPVARRLHTARTVARLRATIRELKARLKRINALVDWSEVSSGEELSELCALTDLTKSLKKGRKS